MHINDILKEMVGKNASDLHLKAGSVPTYRINGVYVDSEFPVQTSQNVRDLINEMTDDSLRQKFDEERELDFAYAVEGLARFRVNVYLQTGNLASVIRVIPLRVMTIDELGLPQILKKISEKTRGLVLVTGPTGSGKSTTIAAMIDHINSTRRCHIMTIEDPVEFIHKDKSAKVDQREVGRDTLSFTNALKRVLRQDPNVILIGEIRDLETIATAMTAAETGHLVFATLHTGSVAQTIDRIVDVFPPEQQQQIRSQLSLTLEAIICQVLLPKADNKGRAVALEIMLANHAIRNMIRENELAQIPSTMLTGKAEGMQIMDNVLKELVNSGTITYEAALTKAHNPDSFRGLLIQDLNKKK
ncbi:MAG: type IV pili twitching motility protein PilT [Candidatus Firestonebacteria bacterium RIFOXYA2_FULL_40_8]|nr:MAG: type IV pili twitching motility protein PilT [Candidatus Firestonebacteria bacterium RIFOXYA2_FULL_40_8]